MGAKNTSTANANYYGVAYGYLSTAQSTEPVGKEEVTEKRIKAAMQKFENVDLRNVFIKKDGKYPYQVFYQTISGVITKIEKTYKEGFGFQLLISMLDEDGEISIITIKFYNKYVENFLNRLLNVTSRKLTLSPYSIPSDYEGRQFLNQGILIRESNEKIPAKIKAEELPAVEEITNPDGTKGYSRVKRIDFLYEKAVAHFNSLKSEVKAVTAADLLLEDEEDDLPF